MSDFERWENKVLDIRRFVERSTGLEVLISEYKSPKKTYISIDFDPPIRLLKEVYKVSGCMYIVIPVSDRQIKDDSVFPLWWKGYELTIKAQEGLKSTERIEIKAVSRSGSMETGQVVFEITFCEV